MITVHVRIYEELNQFLPPSERKRTVARTLPMGSWLSRLLEFACRLLKKKYSLAGEDVSAFMSGLTPEQLEAFGEVILDAENVPGIHS